MNLTPDQASYPAEIVPPSRFPTTRVMIAAVEAFPGAAVAVLIAAAVLPGDICPPLLILLLPAAAPGFGWLLAREFAVGCLMTAGHAVIRLVLIAALGIAALGAFTDYSDRDHPCGEHITFEGYAECQRPWRVAYGLITSVLIAMPLGSAAYLLWRSESEGA